MKLEKTPILRNSKIETYLREQQMIHKSTLRFSKLPWKLGGHSREYAPPNRII